MPVTGDTITAEMEEEPAAESNPSRNCSIPAPLLGCKGLTGANNKLPSFSLQKQLNKVAFLDSQAAQHSKHTDEKAGEREILSVLAQCHWEESRL